MAYYGNDEDIDIHVHHRGQPPVRPRYVASPPRPRSYYAVDPPFLSPDNRTTVVARARSLSRQRRESAPAPANPVIINNRFYNDPSSSDEESSEYSRRRRRREEKSRRDSSSRSRSRSRLRISQNDWEAELARRELERLRIAAARDRDERRIAKEYRDEAELQRAKRELDEIKDREARTEQERRIKKELELKRLREEEEEAEQKKLREREAEEAVERYKLKEAERIAEEARQKETYEREYKRRLHEDLIQSGLDDKAIAAILKKEKIPEAEDARALTRPTYTRMARRHLSIETLRTFRIDFDVDGDPDYVLIKRWVPEWEQDQLWRHTKHIRGKRGKALLIEDKKYRPDEEAGFEWVRRKSSRKRSKSPSLLMYLAGARQA